MAMSLVGAQGKTLTVHPDEVSGKTGKTGKINLLNSSSSSVVILEHSSEATVENLRQCHVVLGPCRGLVDITNCVDCFITVAAKHVRIVGCTRCTVFLYSEKRPFVEDCVGVHLGPYNTSYRQLGTHFVAAGLDATRNAWSDPMCAIGAGQRTGGGGGGTAVMPPPLPPRPPP